MLRWMHRSAISIGRYLIILSMENEALSIYHRLIRTTFQIERNSPNFGYETHFDISIETIIPSFCSRRKNRETPAEEKVPYGRRGNIEKIPHGSLIFCIFYRVVHYN